MTQGIFSKEEAKSCREALAELMKAFPKSKTLEFFGHFNDIDLFLMAAEKAAPNEQSARGEEKT
jgi:hypothetical protein